MPPRISRSIVAGFMPEGVVGAALDVGDRDDLAAGVVEVLRGEAADLAEALDRDRHVPRVDAGLAQRQRTR